MAFRWTTQQTSGLDNRPVAHMEIVDDEMGCKKSIAAKWNAFSRQQN